MAKIGRNAPCPCGSGKKYKKCCLPLQTTSSPKPDSGTAHLTNQFLADPDDLDNLSNSVLDLVDEGRLDEAEQVCHKLMTHYPDQIDGLDRLGHVYEAKGEKRRAAEYYRKAAAFAQSMPDFDQEGIDRFLSKAGRLESEE